MYRMLAVPLALLAYFTPLACSLPPSPRDTTEPRNLPLRILPLGDSITWGDQGHASGTNGYRARLLSRLVAAGYDVDFVGTQQSGNMADNDNEGHPGYTISAIQGTMAGGLAMKPDVVLLHAGTNDMARSETTEELWADAPKRLGVLIDGIFAAAPDALVIVAKITPAKDAALEKRIKAYNVAMPGIVKPRVKKGLKLTVVNQHAVKMNELADGAHPNDAGYSRMGDIWFRGIQAASKQGLIDSICVST